MTEDRDKRQEAMEWVGKAYQFHMRGEVDKAIEFYNRSLTVLPTAEALTFRGWAHSFNKDYDQAIADCHAAIDLDPEFGNPYNDIGAYYVELGQLDDAIPWLKMALTAFSTKMKAMNATAATAKRPSISAEFQAYSLPPQTNPSKSGTRVPASNTLPI